MNYSEHKHFFTKRKNSPVDSLVCHLCGDCPCSNQK